VISNSEVSFCVDTLLVETILAEPKLYKTAGFVSDLLEKVKEYFSAQMTPGEPVSSVLRIIAPGALWLFLSSIGLGKWGFLLGLLMDVFHIDAPGLLKSLFEKVKGMISGGQKVSSEQIDSAAESAAQEFATPGTQQEAQQGYEALQQKKQQQPQQEEGAKANDHVTYSSLELMHDAKMIRLALINYENQKMRLTKEADISDFFKGYGRSKSRGTTLLSKIFGWVIKIALYSAGLMVIGDVINAVLGRPSALTHTYQAGKESPSEAPTAPPPTTVSTQTKFPKKGDAPLPASWPLINNPSNIENMLIQFTKDVYSGLDGKEDIIRNTPSFDAVKDNINWFNVHNPGSAVIFLPKTFTSKKQLVDYYIDDVAESVK
jgi:hypothetical protein